LVTGGSIAEFVDDIEADVAFTLPLLHNVTGVSKP
jgi:hypothetical protein